MKALVLMPLLWVLYINVALAQVFPVENILVNGPNGKRINFVYLSDGYQSGQLPNFVTKANTVNTSLFNQSPFLEYKNFFNAYAIKVPSTESGAKHAGTATDVPEPASPVMSPNNYFGSRFDVSNIHRLLVPASTSQVVTVASANVPDYDQLLMLVNDGEYGGSGGTVATSSTHSSSSEIMFHEIGHSFANLGDEYWFNCQERKNRTANNNPATVIWKNWLNTNGISIYQIGSSGGASTCYRPHQNCKMQVLGSAFCAVCKEAFIDKVYQLVSPIDNFVPSSNSVSFSGASMDFGLTLILPNPNTLQVEWVLNGTTVATSGNTFTVLPSQLVNGSNNLQAKVTDGTLLSRAYWPATSGYLHSVTWNISYALPVELLDFQAQLVDEQAILDWETATEQGSAYFEVQKSEDGISFEPIGKVVAAGNSNTPRHYRFIDADAGYSVSYYRLKQVDSDGASEMSPVRVVNRIDKIRYEIFPNPADEVLQVRLDTQVKDVFTLRILDMNGRVFFEQTYEPAGALAVEIPVRQLVPGQYALNILMGATGITRVFEKI